MLSLTDTILAQASAAGVCDLAIIRIAGPNTSALLQLVQANKPRELARGVARILLRLPRSSTSCSGNALPLPATVLRFPGPNSYTGDDAAEVVIPGNPQLVQRLIGAMLSHDTPDRTIRLAQPGEFTARAFLRGRLSLAQAEGVASTIAAANQQQLAGARELLSGVAGARYRHWADELTTLLALVEAGIDFTDQEDVVAIAPNALRARLEVLRGAIRAQIGHVRGYEPTDALPRVVLAGAPNAGKSTLFNALLGRTRAVASPTIGTTRDVLAEELDLGRDAPGAGRVLLCDLPGLDEGPRKSLHPGRAERGEARAQTSESDIAAQRRALETLAKADLVLWCQASGASHHHQPRHADVALDPARTLLVHTFADRAALTPDSTLIAGISAHPAIFACALDGWNLGWLRRMIAAHALAMDSAGAASLLPRHRESLGAALASLELAQIAIAIDARILANPEAVAHYLRSGLNALGQLVGHVSPDDVIGRVFATFCVGK